MTSLAARVRIYVLASPGRKLAFAPLSRRDNLLSSRDLLVLSFKARQHFQICLRQQAGSRLLLDRFRHLQKAHSEPDPVRRLL